MSDIDEKPAKAKKGSFKRYFDNPVPENELQKIKLKPKNEQNFTGEVISVDQTQQKPYRKFNKNKYNNKQFKNENFKLKKPQIKQELLAKYQRGQQVSSDGVKTNYFKAKQARKEIYLDYAVEQAARTELLLHEEQGFIQPEAHEVTAEYRQSEIVQNVDIQSASKHFKLKLEFGPYCMRYTKNGRHLLLGGKRGHIAAFDWVTKRLHCEFNAMQEISDVSWLHVHTMFAVAQKKWVYFYDSQGTELHCVKRLNFVNRMEFLPYHFLLATANTKGYLSWLDVSIGELVGNYNTRLGDLRLMRNNPANGVLCLGGGKGVVSMWSPKVREPLAKLVCHATPMSALSVDPKGLHMITAGLDKRVKIWDVRELKGPLAIYQLRAPANQVEVSQRGVLGIAQGTYTEVYHNLLLGSEQAKLPYLRHHCDGFVHGMRFCNYEDVLGIATANGFESMLVPGAGEANYDALEDNPYQTAKQRREHEVHALLEKIPAEFIALNPNEIANVDVPTLQEKIDAKRAVFFLKPPQIDIKTRHKMKGRGGTAKAARNKQIVKDQKRKEFVEQVREAKKQIINEHKVSDGEDYIPLEATNKQTSVLDRFKTKQKR